MTYRHTAPAADPADLADLADLPDAVAVTGLACRFPGAPDAGAFLANLVARRESVTFRGRAELAALGVPEERLADPRFVGAGGVLDGLAEFDAEYFGIPPREADLMDPQHRLFLQCAVAALEDAGQPTASVEGGVGVYAAAGFNSYLTHHLLPHAAELSDLADVQWLASADKDYLATRTSYRLGLTGPSMSVQSACSSGLVAVHLAAEALLSGECGAALAGAVSAGVGQGLGYVHAEGGILSADGHCRPFDADATGTVFGAGVGVVVLKRLADAVADGDLVRAVILGSAVNNDGSRKVGFTAPGLDGQVRVVRAAQAVAGVTPEQVGYVEAHGTGTALGDRIELTALGRVFGPRGGPRVLGAVKSNIGHLDTCAGMAGLIKAVLSLQHRTLLPTAHFSRPAAELAGSGFRVLTEAAPWPGPDGTRVAGVSSFGIGGTNAHVVLGDAPPLPAAGPPPADPGWEVLPVSARSPEALDRATARLGAALTAPDGPPLADAAHTLQTRRRAHPWRRAVPVARHGGPPRLPDPPAPAVPAAATAPRVVLLFPGQGVGHPGVAAEPYRAEPAFRRALDDCLDALRPWTGAPLRELLLDPAHPDLFDRTDVAQPALFALGYALAEWWAALGVRPAALVGHSVGEWTAACVAGVFPLDDAARLVAERGRLAATMPAGAMLAVPLPEARVRDLLAVAGPAAGAPGGGVDLAAVNAPDRCVVAGPPAAVAELRRRLAAEGVHARPLAVRHAFHSAAVDPLLAEFGELVAKTPGRAPSIPLVSTLTGEPLTPALAASAEHWTRQQRATVRFTDALAAVPATGALFLETGPGRSLSGFVRRTLGDRPALAGLDDGRDGATAGAGRPPARLAAVARLWELGSPIRWSALGERAGRRHVPLPTYPFEPARHWYEPRGAGTDRAPAAGHPPAADSPAGRADDVDRLLHVLDWRPTAPPDPSGPLPRTVLLLADSAGLGERVARRLTAAGCLVRTVRPAAAGPAGSGTAGSDTVDGGTVDGGPRLDPDDPAGPADLAAALAASGTAPDAVVCCWPVDAPDLDAATADEAARHALHAVTVPAFLARALGEAFPSRPIRMLLVTDAAHGAGGQRPRAPHTATALGAVRGVPRELPALALRALDLDCPARDGAELERAADAVVAELPGPWPGEPLVAVRGRARLVPVPGRPALAPPDGGRPLPGGTWLITGGLGGVGTAVAGLLAEEAGAEGRTLVLVTRRPVPEGPAWTVLRPDGAPPGAPLPADLAARLGALTRHGAAVCLAQADVTDADAMAAVVYRARRRFGPVTGVVHAAGIPGGGVLARRTADDVARVLDPKVRGTLVLHRLTARDRPLTVWCSSVLSVSGAAGRLGYIGANAFLDSLAHATDRAVSVGWDRWAQTGMAVRAGTRDRSGAGEPLDHPLFDARATGGDGAVELRLRRGEHTEWLAAEHRLAGVPVLPGTALLALATAAHDLVHGPGPVELDAVFAHPLALPADHWPDVTVRLLPDPDGGHRWEVRSSASPGRPHGHGRIAPHRPGPAAPPDRADTGERRPAAVPPGPGAGPRPRAEAGVVATGPRWQCLTELHEADREAVLRLRLPDRFHGDLAAHALHPALLDVATGAAAPRTGTHLPVAYRRLVVHRELPAEVRAHVVRHPDGDRTGTVLADVTLTGPDGVPAVRVEGFVLRPAPDGAAAPAAGPEEEGLRTGEALAALRRVLANPHLPHVLVTPRGAAPPAEPRPAAPPPGRRGSGPGPVPEPPGDALERRIADVCGALLGLPAVAADDNVVELGADSLLVVQISAELQRAGLPVSPGDVFAHPTAARLAAHLRAGRGSGTDLPDTAADPAPGGTARPAGPGAFPDADLDAADLAQVLSVFRPGKDSR
ncbi:hypothetical protein GCM10027168_64680 [Streptomyces capparidis]